MQHPDLQPCDIVLFRGPRLLSRWIRKLTCAPGEEPSWANHVGFVVEGGPFYEAVVQEAVNKVRRVTLTHYVRSKHRTMVRIYRPIDLEPWQVDAILRRANKTLGRFYGYGKLVLHAMDAGLGRILGKDTYAFRRLGISPWPICSSDIVDCWVRALLSFDVPRGQATPDDIEDFCRTRHDQYQLICIAEL